MLTAAQEKMENENFYGQRGLDIDWLVQVVADLLKIDAAEGWKRGKKTISVQAKSLVCYWATQELGLTATAVGKRLAITTTVGE